MCENNGKKHISKGKKTLSPIFEFICIPAMVEQDLFDHCITFLCYNHITKEMKMSPCRFAKNWNETILVSLLFSL